MQNRVPKLRFPEFSEEWEIKKLSAFSDFQEGPGIMAIDFRNDGVPLIRLSGLAGQSVTLDGCNYLDPHKVMQRWGHFRLRKGDLLLSSSASLGAVSEVGDDTEGAVAYTGIIRFRPVANESTKSFLKQILISNALINQVASMSTGATIHHFGPTHLKQMSFTVPELAEQEKIAGFLMAVDERVAVMSKKVELLQQYKKGVMQKIFSQKLRFKDQNGTNYPDWQIKKAGEVFSNISNRNHKSDLPVLSITQDEGVVRRDSLDRKIEQSDAGVQNYKIIEPKDFVISLRSFQGGIEMSTVLGISSPAYTVLRGSSRILPELYKHYFKREEFISQLNSTIIGIRDGKQISYGPFSTLRLPVPTIAEQQKIANFLASQDDKISLEKAKLEQAKLFKKSLLQRMFA